jgi:predicted HTH domain antitoxin
MTVEIPEKDLGPISLKPQEARIECAVGLYTGRLLTLGQASRIAGIPYVHFMREIARRGLTINYSVEDAMHDLEVARGLSPNN